MTMYKPVLLILSFAWIGGLAWGVLRTPPSSEWHSWYCWRPVYVDGRLRWLSVVERRRQSRGMSLETNVDWIEYRTQASALPSAPH